MSRLAQLYASLEDNVEPVFSTPEEEKDNELKVIEANAELKNDGDEIDDLNNKEEELTAVASGVDAVAAEMRALIEHGVGLSVESAAFAHHAINAYLCQVGLTSDDVMPSLESFVDPDDRLYYTKVSLEAAESASESLWQKVVRLWKFIYEKVSGWIKSLLTKIGILKKKSNCSR